MRKTVTSSGAVAAAVLLALPAAAKQKTVEWENWLCTYEAKYDPDAYSPKKIVTTHQFVTSDEGVDWPYAPMISEPSDVAKIDIPRFQAQCERALNAIGKLELVELPSVIEYRRAKIEEVSDTCAFGVARLRSYSDPSALRSYQPSEAMCSRYIDALEGKTDIGKLWREMIDARCKNNADPRACREQDLSAGDEPDGADRIRLYVTGFGWNNCSTHHIKANTTDFNGLTGRFRAEFNRKFKVKEQCGDP